MIGRLTRGGKDKSDSRRASSSGANKVERDLLEKQIQKRDDTIKGLEHSQAERNKRLSSIRSEIDGLKRQQMEQRILHRVEADRIRREKDFLQKRVDAFRDDLSMDAVPEYANLVKDAAPKSVDSSYVMRLQVQLSKASKKMENLTHQTDTIQHTCDEVVHSLQADIAEVVEERCKTELELLDQVDDLKKEVIKTEERMKKKLVQADEEYARTEETIRSKQEILASIEAEDGNRPDGEDDDDDGSDQSESTEALRYRLEDLTMEKEHSIKEMREQLRVKKEQLDKLKQASKTNAMSIRLLQSALGCQDLMGVGGEKKEPTITKHANSGGDDEGDNDGDNVAVNGDKT